MANIVLAARGGTPDFKGFMCEGQWSEYGPSYSSGQFDYTPPFNSHADAVYGQGWLNLHFPLVPNLDGTMGHEWMRQALRGIKQQDDVILTNWVPLRSYVDSIYVEVSRVDPLLEGVTLRLVAHRAVWDFDKEEFKYDDIEDFQTALKAAKFPDNFYIGEFSNDHAPYGFVQFAAPEAGKKPLTFGHNIVKRDLETNEATGGFDEYFGAVMLGFRVASGDAEKIAKIYKSNIAVHLSAKLIAFEGSTQVG